jgi:nitrite reductase/ring-hydroxylating ferredoxin subunit
LGWIGLVDSISEAVINIDTGRKGFAIQGKEREGRISYETGIADAMAVFQKAQATSDPETIILVEYTFISQELQLCDKSDKDTFNSLTQAIQSFDDAFLVLKIVEDKTLYQAVENSCPHSKKYRVSGFPKDSFHIACISHKTRLQNVLRSPGIDPIEKTLLKQRFVNLSAGQGGYIEMQRKAVKN